MKEILLKLIDNLAGVGVFFASIVATIITILTFRRAGKSAAEAAKAATLAQLSIEQSKENAVVLVDTVGKLDDYNKKVDGQLDKLIKAEKGISRDAGVIEGMTAEKDLNTLKEAAHAEGKAEAEAEEKEK